MPAAHLPASERIEHLLDAALRVAERDGYHVMTRRSIAQEAGVARSLVSHHLGDMPKVRTSVMEYAVSTKNARVVGQGMAARDPVALAAPDSLKSLAARTIKLV
jgi:AcrR family transcriptional regulator